MDRRKLLASGGAAILLGASGCIDELRGADGSEPTGTDSDDGIPSETGPNETDGESDSNDPSDGETGSETELMSEEALRDETCSHVPDDEDLLDYTETEYLSGGTEPIIVPEDGSDDAPTLALVRTQEEAESRLQPEETRWPAEAVAGIRSFVDETDFDRQVLVVWQTVLTNTGRTSEVVGVTRPDTETIHAYLCEYGTGGGYAERGNIYLLRADGAREPERAKVTYRSGSATYADDPIETDETTYETE